MAYSALVSLAQTTHLILNPLKYSISVAEKEEITSIRQDAISLISLLESFPKKANRLEGKMRDVAAEAEDIIEDFMWSQIQASSMGVEPPRVEFEQQLIKAREEIGSIIGDTMNDRLRDSDSPAAISSTSRLAYTGKNDEVIGLDKELLTIKTRLCGESSKLEVIPILCMGGIGKSTLARCAFDDRYSMEHFYILAWITISQDYSPRDILSCLQDSMKMFDGLFKCKNDLVIGLDEELLAIKGRLCGESSKLEVIPILGMGGIGKTTLARYAYDDRLTVEHFHVRAWITISQDYSAQNILSCLRDSMKLFDKQMLAHDNEFAMGEKVYKCLKGRRYLIVMDDVWSTKALDDVRHTFPDDDNGSRIMLTTRLSDVATYVSDGPVCKMKLMDEDQCWNLIKQKTFTTRSCPFELEDVGKEIARSCRGLPLAVVLVAGVLSKVVETRSLWEEIAKNANSVVGGQLEKILSLSYTNLPHDLRSCFLYMGGFPEDHEVRVSELIKLWVAEGFLNRKNESKSFEEEAEECLEDLVERSLVFVSSRKSNGKIKSCSLHDLVRDMCIRKAREEKFLAHASDECVDERRLKIINSDNLNNIFGSTFRTILFFGTIWLDSSKLLEFLRRCKLLRVLDVRYDSSLELPCQLFELFHLRYLALRDLINIPSTISKFTNLHTLIIKPKAKQSRGKIPLEIWRMPQLRHLVIYYLYVLPFPADGSFLPLENLQTLLEVKCLVWSEEFLKMFPNVKKLGLIYNQKDDDEERDHQLHNLKHLGQLEKLKVTMRNFSWEGRNPAFPKSLKKLTLFGGGFPWNDMTIVGSLPNLEVLKLINHACDDDDTWEMTDGGFPRLKFLLIESSTLRNWITECCPFPALECLILRLCLSLYEVPDSIVEISSLEIIEVECGSKSLVKSVKDILEDQQINGNYALQVHVVSQNFSVERMSGKKCYMIGARELVIAWSDKGGHWQWKPCADSRFSEVVELNHVFWLDIRVKIKTQMLSSNTTYAAYLVFKLAKGCRELKTANAIVRYVNNEDAEETSIVVYLQQRGDDDDDDDGHQEHNGKQSVWRDDGWMEVEMGSFYNDDDGGVAVARLSEIRRRAKSGLIIEGIEFRPKPQFDDLEDEHPFVVSQSQMISLEEMSGKKCYMVGANELMIVWGEVPLYWQWKPCLDSRFSEVAELIDVCWLDIRVIIKTQMLSMNTTYAAYLVFKLAEECYGLESVNAAVRFGSDEYDEETSIVVHLQQLADDDGAQEQNGRHPVWRDDGWMEVEMGSFYNNHDNDDGVAEAKLTGIDGATWKKGLTVEGIEFRPKAQFDPQEN